MAEWQEDSYGKIMFNTVLPHGYMRLLGIHRTAKLAWQKRKKNPHLHSLLKFKLETLGFYSDSDLTTLRCETKTPADRERAVKWHITMWAVCWIGSSAADSTGVFLFKFRRRSQVVLPTLSFSRLAYNKMQSLFSKSQLCILLVQSDKIHTCQKKWMKMKDALRRRDTN